MYSDPALIRKHVVKLSLSDQEASLIDSFCNYTGEQKAVLLRELVMKHVVQVMGHGMDSGSAVQETPRLYAGQM